MAVRKRITRKKARTRPVATTATLAARIRTLERQADATSKWIDAAHDWIRSVDRILRSLKTADPVPETPKWPVPKPGPGGGYR